MSTPTLVRVISSSNSRLRRTLLKKTRPPMLLVPLLSIARVCVRKRPLCRLCPLRQTPPGIDGTTSPLESPLGLSYQAASMRLATPLALSVASYSARMNGSSIQ